MSGTVRITQLAALNDEAILQVTDNFAGQVVFQLVDAGSWNGTVTFYGSMNNGTTYVAIMATNQTSDARATTTTAAGLFTVDASGLTHVKAKATTLAAGAMDVFAKDVTG